MQLTTPIEIPKFSQKIDYNTRMMFIGSCFSDHIGEYLSNHKFKSLSNPFGSMYNPLSVVQCIEAILDVSEFVESDLQERKGQFFNYNFHGSFSDSEPMLCLEKMNQAVQNANKHIQNLDYLFITLGTSWVFELKHNNKVVANCHKMPAEIFTRRKIEVSEIVSHLDELQTRLFDKLPNLQIVYTVSPIRHFKDGAIANQQSKASLFVAIDKLLEDNSNIHYFPAYELVNDELRDYRFYARDMVHLSEITVDYIRNKFANNLFGDETQKVYKKVADIVAAANHRPLHPDSIEYKQFCQKMINRIDELSKKYQGLDFEKEIEIFSY